MTTERRFIEHRLASTVIKDWISRLSSENVGTFALDIGECNDSKYRFSILVPESSTEPNEVAALAEIINRDGEIQAAATIASPIAGTHRTIEKTIATLEDKPLEQAILLSELDSFFMGLIDEIDKEEGTALPRGCSTPITHSLFEGALKQVVSDKHERNRATREKCLMAHGTKCAICGFDFADTYGAPGKGLIQVHHIVPLHAFEGSHEVDPIKDLIPLCANCHMVIHSKGQNECYSPNEVKEMIASSRDA